MKIRYYQEMSLKDWKAHGLSQRNKKFLAIRKSDGINKNKLKDITWDGTNLKMVFEITPTYKGKKDPSGRIATTFPNYDKHGSEYFDSTYEAIVEMANLGPELEDWDEMNPNEKRKKVFKLFDSWEDIKFYCSCASWLGQGAWKRAADLDSSVYPMPGLSDKGWWELGTVPNAAGRILGKDKAHDNSGVYLCKHIAGILEQVKFLSNEVISKLDQLLTGHKIVKKAKEDELEKPEKLPKAPKKKKEEPKEPEVKKPEKKKSTVKTIGKVEKKPEEPEEKAK